MKKVLFLITFLIISLFSTSQNLTWEEWESQSETNIRLLPKYGNKQKTEGQLNADKNFIQSILKQGLSLKDGAKKFIDIGFKYLYSDNKIAMYRFNQAYLLDADNTDIYWGYGAVYMMLGQSEKAKSQYEEGLALNPKNTHLLTDLGTYYLAEYYKKLKSNSTDSNGSLDKAIEYLKSSFKRDRKDMNTTFKLSVCYFLKNECKEAVKFYEHCKKNGGDPITKEFEMELKTKCDLED